MLTKEEMVQSFYVTFCGRAEGNFSELSDENIKSMMKDLKHLCVLMADGYFEGESKC